MRCENHVKQLARRLRRHCRHGDGFRHLRRQRYSEPGHESGPAAVISDRLDVKTAHFLYGASKSTEHRAGATIIASSGPNATAAKSIGSSEIEIR